MANTKGGAPRSVDPNQLTQEESVTCTNGETPSKGNSIPQLSYNLSLVILGLHVQPDARQHSTFAIMAIQPISGDLARVPCAMRNQDCFVREPDVSLQEKKEKTLN